MNTSIIICTYNEEKTISDVVSSCCKFNPEREVIVVDDGSTDETENILNKLKKEHSFRYEKLKNNKGKSWAMAHGVEQSKNDIVLFFDADVSNIRKEHFECLVQPILNRAADMVLGPPSDTFMNYKLNPFKSFTGERALLKKDILPILDDIRDVRFGVETFINLYFQANGKRVKYVQLDGLKHPTKFDKTSPLTAAKELISEGQEIAVTFLKNYDLVLQRLGLLIKSGNDSSGEKPIIKKAGKKDLSENRST